MARTADAGWNRSHVFLKKTVIWLRRSAGVTVTRRGSLEYDLVLFLQVLDLAGQHFFRAAGQYHERWVEEFGHRCYV